MEVLLWDAKYENIKEMMNNQLEGKFIQELLSKGCLYGELIVNGGSFEANNSSFYSVKIEHASHRVVSYRWDENKLYGEIEFLKTMNGTILEWAMSLNKDCVEFFPRALCTKLYINEQKTNAITSIDHLMAFDCHNVGK